MRGPGRVSIVAISLLWSGLASAQNLVPNPSFELFIQCPSTQNNVNGFVQDWMKATLGTPDYFNACSVTQGGCFADVPLNFAGSQGARTGSAYGGLFSYSQRAILNLPNHLADQREYLEVQLVQPLTAATTYRVRFFVSLAEGSSREIQQLGAYLSPTQVTSADALPSGGGAGSGPIPVVPQYEHSSTFLDDVTNWVELTGTFTAAGGESWLVIGNFRPDATTTVQPRVGSGFTCGSDHFAYYYVDDVSVEVEMPIAVKRTGWGRVKALYR